MVPRVLVAATEVSGSCLHFLRDRSYWLCVFGRKIHSVARLHLLESTVLLDNHCLTWEVHLWTRRVFYIGSTNALQLNGSLI